MGFRKQPIFRVVVATLQHCLAKARLALLIDATIIANLSNHQLDNSHAHNVLAERAHTNA